MAEAIIRRVSGMDSANMKAALKNFLTDTSESVISDIADSLMEETLVSNSNIVNLDTTSWIDQVTKIINDMKIEGPITTIHIPSMENISMEELYNRMRLLTKLILHDWLKRAKDSKNKSISLGKLRPALALAYSKSTNKFYIARNLTRTEVAGTIILQKGINNVDIVEHPYVIEKQNNLRNGKHKDILESYEDMTVGAGTHAECLAFNEALIDADK